MTQTNSKKLTAEVISIGDEMTSGARLDTNSQWLSQRLAELGIEVLFHTTVCDTLACNVDVFRSAANRVDVIVCTGGLGPTRDDLTRDALAEVSHSPLEFRQQAWDHIEALFASRSLLMSDRNRLQAMFPSNSKIIPNALGTAPGIDQQLQCETGKRTCRVFALPGVPAEMKPMFDQYVAAELLKTNGEENAISSLVMKFFGAGESAMEEKLGDMISRDRQPRVGITVSAATISLRIIAQAKASRQCETMIADTKSEILKRISEYYFGDGEQFEQYHAIDLSLKARSESLMVIELGYAAPLNDWFASLGETPAYRGGISLANQSDLLKITTMPTFAEAMGQFKSRYGAEWLLLVDSYPNLGSSQGDLMPTANVNFVVAGPDGVLYEHAATIGGHPEILQPRIGKVGMQHLRRILASQP